MRFPSLPYAYILLQVACTFSGGYLWHLADSKKEGDPVRAKLYLAAFFLLAASLYLILTVHLKVR